MSETTAKYETKNADSPDQGASIFKQFARVGIFYLEEAVLEVMGDEPLKAWEISKRLGIPAYSEQNTWNYAIVHGILRKLQAEGRVERSPFPTTGQDWKRIDMDV